jgi:hypothetical protein
MNDLQKKSDKLLENDTINAWSKLPNLDTFESLSNRFKNNKNLEVRSRILEICASVLHQFGAQLVISAWRDYPKLVSLPALAQASAQCLPFGDGFERVKMALSSFSNKEKLRLIFCLGYFHSTQTLDWIEENIFEPTTESWGYLAAASNLDWQRVELWIHHGRPLSLVAIDALRAIMRPQSPFLRAYAPQLKSPPSKDKFQLLLSTYSEKDNVPRVLQRTSDLIENIEKLIP